MTKRQATISSKVNDGVVPEKWLQLLYNDLLVRWETTLSAQKGIWDIRKTKANLADTGLILEHAAPAEFAAKVSSIKKNNPRAYFVFSSGKGSQSRSLFRHLRNAVAHAKVIYRSQRNGTEEFIFDIVDTRGRPPSAMTGRIPASLLPKLLNALHIGEQSSL